MVKPRILIIEDDPKFRSYSKNSLETNGFEVTEIYDGSELEFVLRREIFDIILSDTNLPNLDGHDACKKAQGLGLIGPDTKVVGMSGNQKNQKYWAGIANFNGFYNKLDFEKKEIGVFMSNYLRLSKENPAIYGCKMLACSIEEDE